MVFLVDGRRPALIQNVSITLFHLEVSMVMQKGVVGWVEIVVTFRELLLVPHVDDQTRFIQICNADRDIAFNRR
jgi:hypothetical protein